MISISVQDFFSDKDTQLELKLAGREKHLSKKILVSKIQRPGLALTGDLSHLESGRIQVLGRAEIRYLKRLPPSQAAKALQKLAKVDVPCFVITHNNAVPPALKKEAAKRKISVFQTSLPSTTFTAKANRFLEERFSETSNVHGVLMDVFGVGILLLGKSGIGKSECALELVMKGHRLVADDVINIRKKPPSSLYGYGSDLIKYHMEIRGLGIINIKDLFGVTSVRDQKLIELVVEMVEWNSKQEYERLGIDEQTYEILGAKVPFVRLPLRPGRSLATIIEVAARNHLLKLKGFYSAREFQAKLTQQILWGGKDKSQTQDLIE